MAILERQGHEVILASRLRSFDRDGDPVRQNRIKHLGERLADRLIRRYQAMPADARPTAWVTYHPYHKSPDWLGPIMQRRLNLPYLVIEASFAPKQAGGPWDLGHRAAEAAIRAADVALAMTTVDHAGLAPLIAPPSTLVRFPPFLDITPFKAASLKRAVHRQDLAERFGLDVDQPWLLAVGMMRDDVKRHSYELLADALRRLSDRRWQLLIVGDGVARPSIERLFTSFGSKRVKCLGILGENLLPACYAASDVYAWPAVREAYGMAMLEAQASGLPVVAGREGGVTDIVQDGVTGMLTDPRDPIALASAVADLLDHRTKRDAMSLAAARFVEKDHSLDRASALLDQALTDASAVRCAKSRCLGAMP